MIMGIKSLASWWQERRLVGKHAAILIAITLTIIPATFAAVWLPARVAFLQLEQSNVAAQLARAQNSIRIFEVNLSKSLGDYADWDDSFNYLNSPNTVFENSTLNPHTMKNMGVDVITYVRFDGTTVFARAVDNGAEKIIEQESADFAATTSHGAFFEAAKSKKNHLAYVRTKRGLYILYSQWQSDSEGRAKPNGFLVMGNLLGTQMLSDALQTDVALNLRPAQSVAAKLDAKGSKATSETKSAGVSSSIGVFGQNGKLLATVDFETPRSLINTGRKALISIVGALFAGIGLMILMLVVGIRRISVARLQDLEAFVNDYKNDAVLDPNVTKGADEIASLARAFERLAGELHQAEKELSQKAYLQGKADSAAGMLHNVRNALAPIRITQEKWLAEETQPYRLNLSRAIEELAKDDIDPSRKADLEQFMLSAARKIALTSEGRISEMQETKSSIDQIAAILGSYDFDTSGKRAGEPVDMLALIRQEGQALAARDGGAVTFDLPDDMPRILGNRMQLVQVLGNILVNAHEAMVAANVPDMKIAVSSIEVAGSLEIRIRDNGDGIDPDDIAKAFHRGYSTRDHKSGGLGMHWSANAMRAMGGSVTLESQGRGLGATAVLTLELAEPSANTMELQQAA